MMVLMVSILYNKEKDDSEFYGLREEQRVDGVSKGPEERF